jgi:prepilin-type N-terminal cleavage/methylation domain-containing protein
MEKFAARYRRQRGYTLIELVTTVAVMGILAAFGASMISDNARVTKAVNSASASADQARYAMQRLTRELREVSYSTAIAGGSYTITSALTAGATSITFTRKIGGADTPVTLSRSGSNLMLQYGTDTAAVLVPNVSSFTLNFYDGSNSVSGISTTTVRYIEVNLTVTDTVNGETIAQRTRVALRNS